MNASMFGRESIEVLIDCRMLSLGERIRSGRCVVSPWRMTRNPPQNKRTFMALTPGATFAKRKH